MRIAVLNRVVSIGLTKAILDERIEGSKGVRGYVGRRAFQSKS